MKAEGVGHTKADSFSFPVVARNTHLAIFLRDHVCMVERSLIQHMRVVDGDSLGISDNASLGISLIRTFSQPIFQSLSNLPSCCVDLQFIFAS